VPIEIQMLHYRDLQKPTNQIIFCAYHFIIFLLRKFNFMHCISGINHHRHCFCMAAVLVLLMIEFKNMRRSSVVYCCLICWC